MFHGVHAIHPETHLFDKDLHEQRLFLCSEKFAPSLNNVVLVLLLTVC